MTIEELNNLQTVPAGWSKVTYDDGAFILMNVPTLTAADQTVEEENPLDSNPTVVYYKKGDVVKAFYDRRLIDGEEEPLCEILGPFDKENKYGGPKLKETIVEVDQDTGEVTRTTKYYISVIGASSMYSPYGEYGQQYYQFGPLDTTAGLYETSIIDGEGDPVFDFETEPSQKNVSYMTTSRPMSVTLDFGKYKANQLLDLPVSDQSVEYSADCVNSNYPVTLTPARDWVVREYDTSTSSWVDTTDKLTGWSNTEQNKKIDHEVSDTVSTDFDDRNLYAVYLTSVSANITYRNEFNPEHIVESADGRNTFIGGDYSLSGISDLNFTSDATHQFVRWESNDEHFVPRYDKTDSKWKLNIIPDGTEKEPVDILFWFDSCATLWNNGSTAAHDALKASIRNFIAQNPLNRIAFAQMVYGNYTIGYTQDGYTQRYGACTVDFTNDSTVLNAKANDISKELSQGINSNSENMWLATVAALDTSRFHWDPNRRHIIIAITDEPYESYYYVKGEGPNGEKPQDSANYMYCQSGNATQPWPRDHDASVHNLTNFCDRIKNNGFEFYCVFPIIDIPHIDGWNDANEFAQAERLQSDLFVNAGINGNSYICKPSQVNEQLNSLFADIQAHDIELTAVWDFLTRVTYHNNKPDTPVATLDDRHFSCGTHELSGLSDLGNSFTYEGYAFNGWMMETSGDHYLEYDRTSEKWNIVVAEFPAPVDLYATWQKEVKIKYHGNGGKTSGGETTIIDARNFVETDSYPLSAIGDIKFHKTATGVNYAFAGWATSPDGEIAYEDSADIYVDVEQYSKIDLYAVWREEIEVYITYHKNDDSGEQPIPDSRWPIRIPGNYNLELNQFTKEDYHFAGWDDQASGEGHTPTIKYFDGEQLAFNQNAEVDLYAVWAHDQLVVSYRPVKIDATGSMPPSSVDWGTDYTIQDCGYGMPGSGYVFVAWETVSGGQRTRFLPGAVVNIKQNQVFDAVWFYEGVAQNCDGETFTPEQEKYVREHICKIWFHSGWGLNEHYEQCCASGHEVYLMPEQFSQDRPDYTFLGWGVAVNDVVVYEDQALFLPMECPTKLYAQWKKKDGSDGPDIDIDEDPCIEGYDPLPVVFRDMSDVRSFKTKFWRWDFGDSIVYGCDTQKTATADFLDANSEYARFELPGDDEVHRVGSANSFCVCLEGEDGTENCERQFLWKDNIDFFHDNLDQCLMNIDYDRQWKSYHYNRSPNLKHFTGINFKSSSTSTSGNSFIDFKKYEAYDNGNQHRFLRLPGDTYATFVGVTGIDDKILPDQCARNSCEKEYDFGNSVAHIYKGPGLYYATMLCSSENQSAKEAGLQGMELADYIYDACDLTQQTKEECEAEKEHTAGCWINVLPVCPCVSGFHVYGTYQGNSWAPDSLPHDSPNRKFLTITGDNYSCDTDQRGIAATGYVGFNCEVEFTDFDGNIRKTKAVSGYAPYLQVGASGRLVPRSLPVTGACMDWSDWNSDYMQKDISEFGAIVRGWPNWTTRTLDASGNIDWEHGIEESIHTVSGDHVYTMPGLYSVGISPIFDKERIRKYMPTVTDYEDCAESTLVKSASGCCILVVEIPPKFEETSITCNEGNAKNEHPSVVTEIRPHVIAGSYPISRIDWDFGDGSEILTISTEGYKEYKKDVIGNLGPGSFVKYQTKTSTAYPMKDLYTSAENGYMNGNPIRNDFESKMTSGWEYERNSYGRLDARDYNVTHVYTRTHVTDHPGGYDLKCSAYAENTNTCVTACVRVLSGGAGLPDFDRVEGYVEMVDVRSDSTFETNVVMQSQKNDRLYVNRIIDTDEPYNPSPIPVPVPTGSSGSGDDTHDKTYYCFIGKGGDDDFTICVEDKPHAEVMTLKLTTHLGVGHKKYVIDSGDQEWVNDTIIEIVVPEALYEDYMTRDGDNWTFEIPNVLLSWDVVDGDASRDEVAANVNLNGKWQKLSPKIVITGSDSSPDATVSLLVSKDYNDEYKIIDPPQTDDGGYTSIMTRECQYVKTFPD